MNQKVVHFACAVLLMGATPTVYGQSMKQAMEHQGPVFPLYFEGQSNRSVLVGVVESVENGTLCLGGNNQPPRPRFVLRVDEVLSGHGDQTESLYGQNTFVFTDAGWSPQVVVGAPWIVVGNRVLVVVEDYEWLDDSGLEGTFRQIRKVWFLMEEKGGNSRVLYEQRSSTAESYKDVAFDKSALADVFASVVQDFSSTEFRVQDVVEAINSTRRDTR
jgi:hypothetical protein